MRAADVRDNLDYVFTARCAAEAPALRGVTRTRLR